MGIERRGKHRPGTREKRELKSAGDPHEEEMGEGQRRGRDTEENRARAGQKKS